MTRHSAFRGFLRVAPLVMSAILCGVDGLAQTVIEYPIPTASSSPNGITAGPDGALWFTEQDGNKIGRIATDGTVTEFSIPTGDSHPTGIALGSDGNLWFTEWVANKIGRITTSGTITEFPLTPPSQGARWITAGPDGNLWFTEGAGVNKVGRITTAGTITEFPVPPSPSPVLQGIAAGSDGNLWFTEFTRSKIGRITPSGTVTEFPITTNSNRGITSGPDGNLWFAENGSNKIGRITTGGTLTEFPIPSPSTGPYGITQGSDGNLWFVEQAGRVARIDTSGAVTEYPTLSGGGPQGIASGPDGAIWFTEFTANKIGMIVPPPPTTITPTPTPTPPLITMTPTSTPTGAPITMTPTPTITPSLFVSAITPDSGPAAGGTPVAVTGDGFLPGASLTIGGVMAESVVVVGPMEIDATTPALLPGTLNDVAVANPAVPLHGGAEIAVLSKGWVADFLDVPDPDPEGFHDYIEKIFRAGVTAGIGGGNYGIDDPVTRGQMAVFLLKAEHGSGHVPPPCQGVFDDVPCPSTPDFPYSDWIEELYNEHITAGCLPVGNYCPDDPVTRAQMAVFLLKGEHGTDYVPPACTNQFFDVPCPATPEFPYSDWIEQLFNEGITAGCLPVGNYCPDSAVTRGQMAVFLTRTFTLP